MLNETERTVLSYLVSGEPSSPTEVADALDLTVQTASRNLRKLGDRGFVTDRRRNRGRYGDGRGYKEYAIVESVRLLGAYDGRIDDRMVPLTDDKKTILSVWSVPQSYFHPVLVSYLFAPFDVEPWASGDVRAIAVFGPVARGDASRDDDVGMLLVCSDDVDTDELSPRSLRYRGHTFVHRFVTESRLRHGEGPGALPDEAIVLYDPENVLGSARRRRTRGKLGAD